MITGKRVKNLDLKNKSMNTFIKDNWFKILAAILLLWALVDNPYGYYQFLRWVILIIAVCSAYVSYTQQKITWAWIFGIMAVLFNPVIPLHFSRGNWQFIDVVAAVIFFISLFNRHERK